MRPVEALTRHASSWGWLVTVSAFALLTAGSRWPSGGRRRTRSAPAPTTSAARSTGSRSTSASADARDRRRRRAGRGRGPPHRPLRLRPPGRGRARSSSGGTLRLRSRCPAALLGSCSAALPADACPTTCRSRCGRPVGRRALQRLPRLGARSTPVAATSTSTASAASRSGPAPQSGDVRAAPSCAPERLELRSRSGDVARVVPPGRYQRRRRERRGPAHASAA